MLNNQVNPLHLPRSVHTIYHMACKISRSIHIYMHIYLYKYIPAHVRVRTDVYLKVISRASQLNNYEFIQLEKVKNLFGS